MGNVYSSESDRAFAEEGNYEDSIGAYVDEEVDEDVSLEGYDQYAFPVGSEDHLLPRE